MMNPWTIIHTSARGTKIYGAAILVGLGSIGKRHLEKLCDFFEEVVVVDVNPLTKKYLDSNYPTRNISFFNSIDELPQMKSYILSVIANWGPDHFQTFISLRQLQIKQFIIEKPMVSRISDFLEIRKALREENLKIAVNMPWIYSNFRHKIEEIQRQFEIGTLANISVSGGAKCLATNGIHYLGLASSLFRTNPIRVNSILSSEKINPRSAKLDFLEGVASWKFADEKYLQINFSNRSNLQALMILNFQFGRIIVESQTASLYQITKEDRASIDKPTRTFYPTDHVLTFNPFIDDAKNDGMDNLYNLFLSEDTMKETELVFSSTEALLGMMVASKLRGVVDLPFTEEISDKFANHDWNIS